MVHTADLELTTEELRVLGSLIEKERATADQYPLTTKALRTACNQKSSRDPVVDYSESVVESAMLSLRDKGYARSVTGSGRTVKHKQVIDEALGLSNAEVSLLGVLMLRGAQTTNELRTRTGRLHDFEDNFAVDEVLNAMSAGNPPLVECIGPGPRQREDRWVHLLAGPDETDPRAPLDPDNAEPGRAHRPAHGDPDLDLEPDTDGGAGLAEPAPARHLQAVPSDPSAKPTLPNAPRQTVGHTSTGRTDRARIAELEAEVASLRDELTLLRQHFRDVAEDLGYHLDPNEYDE